MILFVVLCLTLAAWSVSLDLLILLFFLFVFSIEVLDSDLIGKDKSLGSVEVSPKQLCAKEPLWYPLQGVKSGQLLINTDLFGPGETLGAGGKLPDSRQRPIKGGKGTGPADPSKVKAYGPGLEKGSVMPGRQASFMVDSSKTGPASVTVDVKGKSEALEVKLDVGPKK